MRRAALNAALVSAGIVSSFVVGYSPTAWAGTLHNGWNYSIDSFRDGTEGGIIGQESAFEFYGMAVKQTRDKVYFAFNSNLSLDGYDYGSARNGSIGYGDLFLNFVNQTSVSKANGNLHGIRFNEVNDSKDFGITNGVYSDVTGVGLMTQNAGYSNLKSHRKVVKNKNGKANFGDLAGNTAYFNHNNGEKLNKSAYGYTNIESGNRLGDVEMVSDLSRLGLDFQNFGASGTETFAFSVDSDLLPTGEFIAHLFAECDNDGMALAGTLADIPEPSTIVSLALFGLVGAGYRRLKEAKDQAR